MSLAILTGIADRLAAFILAGYCIVTALLWKQFWKAPDFRLRGESRGREMFWDFLKNLALAGGFLLLAFGTNAAGVQRFLASPAGVHHTPTQRSDSETTSHERTAAVPLLAFMDRRRGRQPSNAAAR